MEVVMVLIDLKINLYACFMLDFSELYNHIVFDNDGFGCFSRLKLWQTYGPKSESPDNFFKLHKKSLAY